MAFFNIILCDALFLANKWIEYTAEFVKMVQVVVGSEDFVKAENR